MTSEKFCLKWNDFQSTVSQSLGLLRREEDFFDVTLISEDQTQISAHKVVLAASSSFFKNIFKRNSHSHPLLYVGGVTASNLTFVLDYIYQGEVQILQDQLDGFLQAAQRLSVKGLMGEEPTAENNTDHHEETQYFQEEAKLETYQENIGQRGVKEERRKSTINQRQVERIEIHDIDEVNEKIKEMIEKVDGGFGCTVCGKVSTHLGSHKRHVETHIEGLSYSCEICGKVFRYSNAKNIHMSRYHRN